MECNLYCYAFKNAKIKLNDEKKLKNYKKEYKDWLNLLLKNQTVSLNKFLNQGPSYVDPDARSDDKEDSIKRKNPLFYLDLCTFLNEQHSNINYVFDKKDEFIKGTFIDSNEDIKINLISDQFGFSAPSKSKKHPYDVYLEKCLENRDEAIDKVIKWVMESRTIGGSFLWTEDIWNSYNKFRGGSKNKGGSYIQDRVDLTLLEIKHYYDKNAKGDVLKIKKGSVGEKWLESFKSFENFVKYFCFDSFVDKDNDYMPYDIVESNMPKKFKVCINEEKIDYKDLKKNSIFNLPPEKLEKMFNNINFMIIERSTIMEGKINSNKKLHIM